MKVLILSPHTDDAELGCGASIARMVEEGAEILWIVFSIAEDSLPRHLPRDTLKKEFMNALGCLGLQEAGYVAEILQEVSRLPSTGSGITLWAAGKGASSLGERGLPAEKVGQRAAEEMERELCSPAAVDVHLADQLIPYLALAGGSYSVREISLHTKTNIWTAGQFMEAKIEIREKGGVFNIERLSGD